MPEGQDTRAGKTLRLSLGKRPFASERYKTLAVPLLSTLSGGVLPRDCRMFLTVCVHGCIVIFWSRSVFSTEGVSASRLPGSAGGGHQRASYPPRRSTAPSTRPRGGSDTGGPCARRCALFVFESEEKNKTTQHEEVVRKRREESCQQNTNKREPTNNTRALIWTQRLEKSFSQSPLFTPGWIDLPIVEALH